MRRNFVYPPQSVLLHRAGGPWQGSYAGKAQGSLERERPRKVISNPPKFKVLGRFPGGPLPLGTSDWRKADSRCLP